MRPSLRPVSVGESQEIFLVDLVEHRHHGVLDYLVFQRRDAQRSLAAVGLWNESPFRRQRPVGAAMNPLMQFTCSLLESDFILLPGHLVHSRSCLPLELQKAGLK